MRPLQKDGSEEMAQHLGRLFRQTLLLLTFFLWNYVKEKVYYLPVRDVSTLIERIIMATEFATS